MRFESKWTLGGAMTAKTVIFLLTACCLIVNAQRGRGGNEIYFDERLGQLTLGIHGSDGGREAIADLTNGLMEQANEKCTQNGADICIEWLEKKTRLTITPQKNGWRQVTWTSDPTVFTTHSNCFPLGRYRWFGGPEQYTQLWPVDKFKFSDYSFVTKENNNQGIADPLWFNSKGIAIIVDKGVPLFIDQNSTRPDHLCIVAKFKEPYRVPEGRGRQLVLSYKIGYHRNAREAFLRSVNDVLGKPTGIPDLRMISEPVWSTWALYKKDINESIVRSFAENIRRWNFTHSQLEIDDDWETCYGSATFNQAKFPNISKLVRDLQRDGFRVTLWTHPFINTNCPLWKEINDKGYFVRNSATTKTKWWNGEAGIIDFTNRQAAKYWEDKHRELLRTSGIDSFKFDAGETSWMPSLPILSIDASPLEDYPSEHTNQYLRTCAKFGGMAEVRSAHRSQDLPIFLRMLDKDTKWGYDNGLKTLVTSLLQMNMVGYSFVLPDMIGGNVYGDNVLKKEIFIRWLEANVFMPALQFSRVPWEFDQTTIAIARKYADLHRNYSRLIIDLMKNATLHGTPVNPPIWWSDPTDEVALGIDSEFMLGENILVAPVMDEGVISRDIYLPAGRWIDRGSSVGTVYEGKQWLKDYPAALDMLPYFERAAGEATRVHRTTLLAAVSLSILYKLFCF